MELGWNGMDCSMEFPVEGNGKGMERNLNFRWNCNGMEWNWNGMEWKWNQNGICNCNCIPSNIIHNSSCIKNKGLSTNYVIFLRGGCSAKITYLFCAAGAEKF